MVIREDGSTVRLMADNKTQREAIAKQLLTPSAHGDHSYGTKKASFPHNTGHSRSLVQHL